MPTIFLVDDEANVRRALSRVMRHEGFEVRDYESAEAFLAREESGELGCLVLDVSMPGLDGLALQALLSQSRLTMPIVFLTGRGDITMSVRAIKSGASDFLTKPVPSATLIAAVREALSRCQGETDVHGCEFAALVQRFDSLTRRECEVLGALIDGKLNKQIADALGVVEQTIKFHRARIMERMHARTLAELMHMAAKLDVDAKGARRAVTSGRG